MLGRNLGEGFMVTKINYRGSITKEHLMVAGIAVICFSSGWLGCTGQAKASEPSEPCARVLERSDYLWEEVTRLGKELDKMRKQINESEPALTEWHKKVLACTPGLGDLTVNPVNPQTANTMCSKARENYENKRQEINSAVEEYVKLSERHNTDTNEFQALQKSLDQCRENNMADTKTPPSVFEGKWHCGYPGEMSITGNTGTIWGEDHQGWGKNHRKGGDIVNLKVNGLEATMDVNYGDKTDGTFEFTLNKDKQSFRAQWKWKGNSGGFSCKR